jgi:toxin ParE1/3/4
MALRLVIAPQAERDLDDIAAYISLSNEAAAYSELLRIERTIDLLLERPFLGPAVLRFNRPGLRKMTVAPYIVFYRTAGEELEVVRVLHSSRDIDDELAVD